MQKLLINIILSFTFVSLIFAQSETPHNATAWYGYEGYHKFNRDKPWGLFLEGYIKRQDIIVKPMQWFFRLGINYHQENGNRISGGVAYQWNIPYDEASEPYSWPDYRIWEQYMIRIITEDNPNHLWVHRIRMEQRWLGRKDSINHTEYNFKFENTFRYMLRSQWWLSQKFGIAVYDELHLRLPPPEAEKIIDQNRIYLGLLFALDDAREWRIESGYMFQSTFNAAEDQEGKRRVNHTFRITITSDVPF